jgi:hypothetical protein
MAVVPTPRQPALTADKAGLKPELGFSIAKALFLWTAVVAQFWRNNANAA